jgi:CheY-like chemotaxis protein
MKVLIADDLPEITDLVEVTLSQTGRFTVIKTHSTMEAVEVAKDNPDIGLVILDKDCLGGGSVTSVLRTLCDGCKIVLYSGGVVGDEHPELFGVDLVVPKGTYPTDILEMFTWLCAA